MVPHLLQGAEQGAVVRLPPLRLVDHELLEGGEPAVYHRLDLRLVLVPAGDADVEGVIDERLPLRLLHPIVGRLVERLTGIRDGEVDHGRDAPPRAGPGAGAVVVGRDGAAERQREMYVDVEHTRQHVVPGRVDDLRAGRRLELDAERHDLLAGDADVAGERPSGSHDIPALDDPIECHQ
jgi:hypothetical protein